MTKGRLAVLTLCLLVGSPGSHSLAVQTQAAQTQPAQTQPAPDPAALDKILAPVALYPDALIAQILFCSTDPDKVRELNSWIQKNQKLKGTELQDAGREAGVRAQFRRDCHFSTSGEDNGRFDRLDAAVGPGFHG